MLSVSSLQVCGEVPGIIYCFNLKNVASLSCSFSLSCVLCLKHNTYVIMYSDITKTSVSDSYFHCISLITSLKTILSWLFIFLHFFSYSFMTLLVIIETVLSLCLSFPLFCFYSWVIAYILMLSWIYKINHSQYSETKNENCLFW